MTDPIVDRKYLSKQEEHWEKTFSNKPEMFGNSPSDVALKAAEVFKKEGQTKILELGGGQGRDTIFFAQNGFSVHVLDYCQSGVETINKKANEMGLSEKITTKCHDIRNPLPFEANTFDGCFSHMLYCMALSTEELEFLNKEIRRVLKTDGLNIYTARNTKDAHFGTGIHRGEDLYEVGGFIVHFFSEEKVRQLAKGYEIIGIDEFEEGGLPRKLFRVIMKKEN